MENNESFNYTYSAEQQQEIEKIRNQYLPKQENKLEQLRRLHRSASKKARSWAIALGVIGALIMGAGMSLAMTNLWEILGCGWTMAMVTGIATGIVGMVLVALAYPLYNRILKKERQRIAPQVLSLTDELMK